LERHIVIYVKKAPFLDKVKLSW